MGRWWGILRIALMSLLMGVGTTYGVAWAIMNRSALRPRTGARQFSWEIGGGVWRYSLVRDFGVIWQMTDLWIGWDAGNVSPPSSRSYERKRPSGWSVTRWESPSQGSRRLDGPVQYQVGIVERASGWPLIAVVERSYLQARPVRWSGVRGEDLSLQFPKLPTRGSAPGDSTSLAFMPSWWGFLVDTLAFAVPWAALFMGFGVFRRRKRVRAGRWWAGWRDAGAGGGGVRGGGGCQRAPGVPE